MLPPLLREAVINVGLLEVPFAADLFTFCVLENRACISSRFLAMFWFLLGWFRTINWTLSKLGDSTDSVQNNLTLDWTQWRLLSVFLDALERLVLALCLGLLLLARPRHLGQVGVDLGLVGGLLLGCLLQGIGRSKLLNVDGKLCHEAQKKMKPKSMQNVGRNCLKRAFIAVLNQFCCNWIASAKFSVSFGFTFSLFGDSVKKAVKGPLRNAWNTLWNQEIRAK